MATYCICNTNETLQVRASSSVRANPKVAVTIGNPLRIITDSKIRASANKTSHEELRIQGESNVTNTLSISANSKVVALVDMFLEGVVSMSGALNAEVRSDANLILKPHKFGGHTARYKSLNFEPQEKLFPSSDFITTLNGTGFRDQNLGIENIFSGIDEGVFTGNIFKDSTFVTDDDNSYIIPYVSGTENNLTYRFGVNPLNTKAEESFFVMRASGTIGNESSDISPLYKFTNIKLLDPSGEMVIKYKDLSFKGDGYYATYLSEPSEIKTRFNTYNVNYPDVGSGFAVGNSGYSVTFDLDIDCIDDPFDIGYNVGYEEFKCDTVDNIVNTLRISAIEIQNSGTENPVLQDYLPLRVLAPLKGQRLVRHIFPRSILASGYDTTIYPSGKSRWSSNAYLDNPSFENSGEKRTGGIFGTYSTARYLRLEEVSSSIPDSGKLILHFQDNPQSFTTNKKYGEFGSSFFRQEMELAGMETFPLQDTFYADIDQINLKIIARKAEGSRDFALDVVGYSNDKLLAVTSPSGGFLQNETSGVGIIPSDVTQDNFGVNRSFSDGSISEGSDLSSSSQVLNSGGDHYLLTQTPLVNSTLFKEYIIPLKIIDVIPELGSIKQYNQSSYFENIFLDIYPIPSGADIADIRLEVYYKPGNAVPMSIVGHSQDKQLVRDTVILDVVPAKVEDPAFNKGDLSSFGTLPHGYADVDNLKTNYSRRWQGVAGKAYATPFTINEFDFGFEKTEQRNPFSSGFYDFSVTSGNYVVSVDDNFARNSGLFNSSLSASVFDHLGWRFNSSGLLTQASQDYKTTDWASGNHELNGKIADAFAHVVRVSGENGYFTFDNAATSGSFTTFIRFTPDETISGVDYNYFNSGVLFSKAGDFGLRYSGGYLQGYINTAGGEINASDDIAYSGYSYPLSVAMSYDGNVLNLYTDNEILETSHNLLRASGVGTKVNTEHNLLLGSGINMFVSAFGHTPKVVDLNTVSVGESATDNATSSGISITNLFDQYRMIFASGDTSYQHRNQLWSYINQDADTDWQLGSYRECSFNQDFDRLSDRADTNYIEHKLTHDGLPYSSRTNLSLPSNVRTTDLAYHTQLENDFLRFHLKDVPDVEGSGKFYAADLRINKSLPRGYTFNKEAFVVQTVVSAENVENIVWPNGDIGPKLIVSLYSKASVPVAFSSTPNYGLVNRSIHNINHDCFSKISSEFDPLNLFNNSEPWADFVQDSYMKEFDHKYFSTEVNDMFLQYDLAYPTHATAFESKIALHAAEVKLKKALVELPTITDSFNLFASGDMAVDLGLNLFSISPFLEAENTVSGLYLYTDLGVPTALSNSVNLCVSGETPYDTFDLYVKGHEPFPPTDLFGSYGSHTLYDINLFTPNTGVFAQDGSMSLHLSNTDVVPSSDGALALINPSVDFAKYDKSDSVNLYLKTRNSVFVDNVPSGGMNLTTMLSDVFLVDQGNPFNLTVVCEPGKSDANLNVYVLNAPAIDTTTDQQQAIHWDGTNVGQDILVVENDYSALSADDEIRGVTTICFGDCESSGICTTRAIVTHGVDWNDSSCINGGIARAQTTYTNANTVGFNSEPSGYDNHFYGIRKYVGLIPHYPYTFTIQGYTGSTETIDIPPEFDSVGFGASDEVNYSGIKHIADDPNAIKARYGKSVAMRGDLMAIGAPTYTHTDSEGSIENAGAVFLYRRNPEPSGFDWSNQEDQASWSLEEILSLPDGFKRDYSYVIEDTVGEPPDATFKANVRKWSVGLKGRNFGHSVDIVSDPLDETKDVVVVGAPKASFDKSFAETTANTIRVLFIVISDNLSIQSNEDEVFGNATTSKYTALKEFVDNRNRYYRNIGNPAFELEPTYIILSATKNLGYTIVNQIDGVNTGDTESLNTSFPEYQGHEINRIVTLDDLAGQSLAIENQIKDIFNQNFPATAGLYNSGIPAFLGLFVDNSASLGRFSVEPAIDNFINYFKEYTFNSGLVDANSNPISGFVIESTEAPDGEEWIFPLNDVAAQGLANDTIINNLSHFTNSFNPLAVPTSSGFNDVPTSGGRVYLFEKEQATSGMFYNEDKYIWSVTQEFGLDKYLYRQKYLNRGYGHAVSISKDTSKIAIGSPFADSVGVRVYEKDPSYKLISLYNKVTRWLTRRVEENIDDVTGLYAQLLQTYDNYYSTTLSHEAAGKLLYENLDPSGRFDLRFYCDTLGGGTKDKYTEVFTYKNDYNRQGTWDFVPENLAPKPRVGYSVSLNDDGNILAVGCPTDSMNQHDDTNVYHKNTKFCAEDAGVNGTFVPGYDSTLESEANLVTGAFNDGGYEGTFQSYVNAGAVQLFDSRRYYPHSKFIEYGIFGNKEKTLASSENKELYFNFMSGVLGTAIPFERTAFTDPEIPRDAGLVFINVPEIDSLSDEVLENIKQWLDLGDRNLVLVGNDPTWEHDGRYTESNKIINNILEKLQSRMRLHPARNQYHSLAVPSGINTIAATVPQDSYDSYISVEEMQASGVADIRLHEPLLETYSHSCSEDFSLANLTCQPDIKHEGDLRAEWFDICTDDLGICVFPARNLQAAYGLTAGLVPPFCDKGTPCFKALGCVFSPNTDNLYKAPTPVLAAAEPHPELFKTIPATPDSVGVNQICSNVPDPNNLGLIDSEQFKDDLIFHIQSSGNSELYSGVYLNFETNHGNLNDLGCEWFKPESLTENYILQATSAGFAQQEVNKTIASEVSAWCADTVINTNNKPSSVTLISTIATESRVMFDAGGDEMINFYNRVLSSRLDLSTVTEGSVQTTSVRIAQLGGWTNRTKFTDGYKDSVLKTEFRDKFIGLGGRPDVTLTENVVANNEDDLINYDIVWIANTDQVASNDQAEILKKWLQKGNKKLIITYGSVPSDTGSAFTRNPSVIHANAAYELCTKLELGIKPLYLTHKKKFATWRHDSSFVRRPELLVGDSSEDHWNSTHPFYSSDLPEYNFIFANGQDQRRFTISSFGLFIPIDTNVINYIGAYGKGGRIPQNLVQIIDAQTFEQDDYYINTGWAKLSFNLPEIQNSGYCIEINLATEDPAESNDFPKLSFRTQNLASKILDPADPTKFTYSQTSLSSTTKQDVVFPTGKFNGQATFVDNNQTKVKIGPLWGTSSTAALYIMATDMTLRENPYNTARIKSIIGYAVPTQIGTRRECVDGEPFVIPGSPAKQVKISPPRRQISTSSEIYCPSQGDACIDLMTTAYNERLSKSTRKSTNEFDPSDPQSILNPEVCAGVPRPLPPDQKALGDFAGPHDTVDGPVIVAQEFYIGNNFEAGVTRSRITVISDSSLIQGKMCFDENNNKKIANMNFVVSLYPYIDFPEEIIYNTRFKITAPERGSPYKWFSATGNSGLIERFIRDSSSIVTPQPMSSFRDHESELNPAFVVRPMEFCECFDSPIPCVKSEQEENYLAGLSGITPYSQFTTIIDGKVYVDNNQLYKDTMTDYLDFDIYKDGYPGDLFGYSVKLTNNRLFVGAPFAAFDQEEILRWSSISGVPSGQVPSGVELSSYGGAGAVYMFEKTLSGGQYIKNKDGGFVKESGSLDWSYSRKFRPESINVGQDLTSVSESIPPSSLDANSYTADELTSLTKETDKFGFSLAIDSGLLVIGAPGHDFGNFVDAPPQSGMFMSKEFNTSFVDPLRTVYDQGTSGIRAQLPESGVTIGPSSIKFGATVLNNGAAYVYSEDYNYSTNKAEWSLLEKIVPEGANTNRQFKMLGSFPEVPFSGSENSRFGCAVSVSRNSRVDSDYCVLVGSKDHPFGSGNDLEERKNNQGASYTYDLILRKKPPAVADSGAFIHSKLFSESGTVKLHEETFFNILNSGLNNQYYENTGIIFSNSDGEIFLEVSGQDQSAYQYIQHRPFISAVYGSMLAGTIENNSFRAFVEGRPPEASGNMNVMILGSGMANVYNDIGFNTFGTTGYASGVPSGLYLFNNAENPTSVNDSGILYVSGNSFTPISGAIPSGLGLFVSGLLPSENSGQLNVFVSG